MTKQNYRTQALKGVLLGCVAVACFSGSANGQDLEALQARVKYNELLKKGDPAALRQAIAEDSTFSTRADSTFDIRLSTSLLNSTLRDPNPSLEIIQILWEAGAELDPRAEAANGDGRLPGALSTAYTGAVFAHPRMEHYRSTKLFNDVFGNGVSSYETRIEIIEFLIDNGADVNAVGYGQHVLITASGAGPDYIGHLLDKGADPTLPGRNGKSFSDYVDYQIEQNEAFLSYVSAGESNE